MGVWGGARLVSRGTCRSQVPAPSAVPRLSHREEGRGASGAGGGQEARQAWLDRRGPHTLERSGGAAST